MLVETANADDESVSFSIGDTPEYLSVSAEPSVLLAKQTGRIRIIFDARKKSNSFGFSKNRIEIKQGGEKSFIDITAIVQEYMPNNPSNEVNNNQPRMSIKNKTFNFETISKGKSVNVFYEITNEGKSDLIIHNVTADKEGFKSSIKDSKIKSGKTSTIKLSYKPEEQGDNNCNVYISTNDPANSLVIANIKGIVK
jgi:hypothetical protein